jgi:hypothetical protein
MALFLFLDILVISGLFYKEDTVNHLVGGLSPSPGASNYQGLALMPSPIFLPHDGTGEYWFVRA